MGAFIREDGWAEKTPDVILDGCALYPGLIPVWRAFVRLSKGRDHSMMGLPLPIKYRDMSDEVQRCAWPDKEELEELLRAMDDEFLELANEHAKRTMNQKNGR